MQLPSEPILADHHDGKGGTMMRCPSCRCQAETVVVNEHVIAMARVVSFMLYLNVMQLEIYEMDT